MGPIVLLIFIFMGGLTLAATAFWIWMIVDCASKEPDEGNTKVVWILVIVLGNLIGALVYFIVRRPVRIQENGA